MSSVHAFTMMLSTFDCPDNECAARHESICSDPKENMVIVRKYQVVRVSAYIYVTRQNLRLSLPQEPDFEFQVLGNEEARGCDY